MLARLARRKPGQAGHPAAADPVPEQHPAGWRVQPAPDGRGAPPKPKPPMIPRSRTFIAFLLGLLAVNLLISFLTGGAPDRPRIPYQPFFVSQVQNQNVSEISSKGDSIEGTLKSETTYDPPGDAKPVKVKNFKTEVPSFIDHGQLTTLLTQAGVTINAESPDSGRSLIGTLLIGFLPWLLIIGFFIWIARRQTGAGGGGILGGFGRATARRVKPGETERITFNDVAGIDEAEDELEEIVDFLKNPQRYTKLGARIPHGVLLYGPPGTGKTLLARAVAGEAHAAFFHLSASEFVEAIVGVGASRVRDLFKQAKEAAPSIVFIDELDAIGRSRSGNYGGISGGNDEREQTLNQILTEMDGFEPGTNVIVLGATNRPEILDPALLRPGRFDRRIAVSPPDQPGRVAILKIHTRSVPLADDVDLERIASSIPGLHRRRHRAARQRVCPRRRPPRPHQGRAERHHGVDREDPPGRRAPDRDDRRRPEAHRLPRVRPRPGRHAHPRRGSGPEDLDHPSRPGTRRHALDPGDRPLQPPPRGGPGPDQGRSRRPSR